jgi:hypothetical protein
MATGTCMRPAARVTGSCRSGFAGLADSLQRLSISAPPPARVLSTPVQGELTGAMLSARPTCGKSLICVCFSQRDENAC